MIDNPLISVIVPVYKVEQYLERCVNSIINQTYKNLEIILVDDGSPDNCGAICDKFADIDNRVKVIHKENGGLSSARNAGLDIAAGDFIAFVDSDDWIVPETYNFMLAMIGDSDIAICGHRMVSNEINHPLKVLENEILDSEGLWREIFGNLNNAAWNKLFKTDLVKNNRFSIGILHGEDLIFNLNYIKNCKTGVLNKTSLYNYFQREGSITGSAFSEKRFLEILAKDTALEIVKIENPKFIKTAEKYCFRARMNVLRSIYKSNLQNNYIDEISKIKKYLFSNYKNIKSYLKSKERIEFNLYSCFLPLYKFLIKVLF